MDGLITELEGIEEGIQNSLVSLTQIFGIELTPDELEKFDKLLIDYLYYSLIYVKIIEDQVPERLKHSLFLSNRQKIVHYLITNDEHIEEPEDQNGKVSD